MKVLRAAWLVGLAIVACVPAERPSIDAEPNRPTADDPGGVTLGPEPSLAMPVGQVVIGPDRKVPILARHTKLARLRLVAVGASDVDQAARVVGVHTRGSDPLSSLPASLRRRAIAHPVAETGATAAEVDVFSIAKSELVLGVLEAPGANPRAALFQQGELSVLLKIGGASGLVWVTSTRSGKPVSGASIVIHQGGSVRFRARTNAQGIARLPTEKRLRVPFVAGHAQEDFDAPLVAVVQSGKHLGLASERWSTGIEPWQFSLPEVYWTGQDALRGSVTAERGIYRPGETAHLLGVVRRRLPNGKLAPPPGAVSVRVRDPDGNSLLDAKVALSRFGTFRTDVPIAKTARLGGYSVEVERDAVVLRHRFEVGEYRPVRFEVSAGRIDAAGGAFELPVSARYLYGAPVAGARLEWKLSARAQRHFGAWSDGYTFASDANGPELLEAADGTTTLDANGVARIRVPAEKLTEAADASSQALELVIEATARDAAGDSVSSHSTRAHLRGEALVGLRSDAWVVSAKQGWDVKVLTAGIDGTPRPGKKVRLRLIRKKWIGAAAEHAGGGRYSGDWQDEQVYEKTIVSGSGPVSVHLPISAGGEYRVHAGLEGSSAYASETVWAYGHDAYGAWDNHARMSVHADRPSYRPGDTAKLWAEVPYAKALALVTLEREGVLEARTLRLDGAGTPIEVPVTEQQAPNVFASVAVVPIGLAGKAPAAGPPLRIGYHELSVSPERRRLRVQVRPAVSRQRPGETARVDVRVTDTDGRPARAEVTLWAADEGVLKLTGYATPDPFVPVHARRPHQVRTAASSLRLVTSVSDEWDEYGGDDAPADDAGAAFRSRFVGTAFFSKGVVTDARGEASVRIPLPDNLTRWRVMAAVADRGERFGSGEAAIETSKPLQIEPALPRFLTRGDELDATVMVHNRTGRKGTAKVRLNVTGARRIGAAEQSVELDAGAQAPVRFALRAEQLGTARIRASAELGSERDGFQIDLPVHAPTLWHTELVGEGRLDRPRKLELKLPASAEPGLAELAVTVAPGVLASIGGGVESLLEYPHGCVEQTTSRLIPLVLLEDLLKSSGDPRLSGRAHRSKMEAAIAHVLEHQNVDGGFGLWPSSESEGFLTAYALWGLLTARDAGYSFSSASIRRGLAYLRKHATHGDDMHGQFAPEETAPFAAFVLAAARSEDGGLGGKLAQKRGKLTRFGVGLLGAAFAEREDPQAGPLLAELAAAKQRAGSGLLIRDDEARASQLFDYGRDLRATAALVRALVQSGKGKDAEELIAGILGQRRPDGSWGTTYNNLWALHAIVDYGRGSNAGANSGRVSVSSGARRIATLDVSPKARLKTARVAASGLPAPGSSGSVTLAAPKGSALRFVARLRYAPRLSSQVPVNKGFSVTRQLVDAKSGAPVASPNVGQLLRVRLTVVTADARQQVALIDRLPAGLEPVDTALATSVRDPGQADDGAWVWRELHDERVTHFADTLPAGTHTAEYLVRATRAGRFVRPAPSAEAMYAPDVFGHGAPETITVKR